MVLSLKRNLACAKNVTLILDRVYNDLPTSGLGLGRFTTLSQENINSEEIQGVKAEGVQGGDTIRGGRRRYSRRAGVKPRVPRALKNDIDIQMAKTGYYRCPLIGIYCNNGSYRDIRKCTGLNCNRRCNSLINRMLEKK